MKFIYTYIDIKVIFELIVKMGLDQFFNWVQKFIYKCLGLRCEIVFEEG